MKPERFEDITEILRARGERIRANAKVIIATGGNYHDTRRYHGYYQRGGTYKLYPADGYTASVTKRPFAISTMLVSVRRPVAPPPPDPAELERSRKLAEEKERKEERRAAEERFHREQLGIEFGLSLV
jgi:hypothetical protein